MNWSLRSARALRTAAAGMRDIRAISTMLRANLSSRGQETTGANIRLSDPIENFRSGIQRSCAAWGRAGTSSDDTLHMVQQIER